MPSIIVNLYEVASHKNSASRIQIGKTFVNISHYPRLACLSLYLRIFERTFNQAAACAWNKASTNNTVLQTASVRHSFSHRLRRLPLSKRCFVRWKLDRSEKHRSKKRRTPPLVKALEPIVGVRFLNYAKNCVSSHAITLGLHLCFYGVEWVSHNGVGGAKQHSANSSK